ncbi:hypothetical protein TNCV_4453041 [Trichonephila clavipes]|nr:hypothetical protein TNCV_4453041 [Trichonephila clavipes]
MENLLISPPSHDSTPSKDLNNAMELTLSTSSNTSRPGRPLESTCKRRHALTEEISQLTTAVQITNNYISNYKNHGVDSHSFLIQNQLQLKAAYEKDIQHVVSELSSLPPSTPVNDNLLDFPPLPKSSIKRKEKEEGFASPHLENFLKIPGQILTQN